MIVDTFFHMGKFIERPDGHFECPFGHISNPIKPLGYTGFYSLHCMECNCRYSVQHDPYRFPFDEIGKPGTARRDTAVRKRNDSYR